MKILIVNVFGDSKKGRREFEHFYKIVMGAVEKYADGDDIIVDVRTHITLDDYVYLPQEVYGITPQVKKAAKEVFMEADADKSGTIDADEMFVLVQILFKRLGVPLRPEFLPLLKEEVVTALELYDDDGSGELEFDEFCSVLCKDPWRELLPTDSRKKEDANRAIRNFCMCDLIFVDGDPHLLPWDKGAVDLLALVRQCMYAQQWPKPACVTLFGSAVITQMMQYLQLVGARVLPVFNGTPPGVGTKIGLIEKIDLSQEAPKVGGLFLDHSTGDTFKWNKAKYDPKFPKNAWDFEVNIGMVMHAGRKEPPRKYDPAGSMQDSTKTVVKRETKAYQHWLFDGMGSIQFLAPVHRNWDVQMRIEGKQLKCLATSMRGVEILEDEKSAVIGTMFSFHPSYRDTVTLVYNFVRQKFHFLRVSEDSKQDWYSWMLSSANNKKLLFWFPPPFRNYTHPVGLQLKKRPKGLSEAQQRMVDNVGQLEPQSAKKMVMDENGMLTEADVVVDPNKEKLAAQKAKADAQADADVNAFEKANAWDAKKDAPTMAKLMSFNKARCITTVDPATGVNTSAGDLGNNDNLFEKMQKGESSAQSSHRSDELPSPNTPERPKTALGLRNVWTPNAATKRRIKPIRRMQSARPGNKTAPRELPPAANATKYEIKAAQKRNNSAQARNMTPEGYRPECSFNLLMQRKEGAAEKWADAFVPNPYTSDGERVAKEVKKNAARFVASAFLTATGPRPVRKISYASEEYNVFNFNRPVIKEKWMRDGDFVKMGRTMQPFDGPLKEPKRGKPPRRTASRASSRGSMC